jgi:hypothetical protein
MRNVLLAAAAAVALTTSAPAFEQRPVFVPHGPFMVAADGKSVINLGVADWWAQKRDPLFATFGFGPFVITVDPTGKLVWSGPFSMAVDSDGKVVWSQRSVTGKTWWDSFYDAAAPGLITQEQYDAQASTPGAICPQPEPDLDEPLCQQGQRSNFEKEGDRQ